MWIKQILSLNYKRKSLKCLHVSRWLRLRQLSFPKSKTRHKGGWCFFATFQRFYSIPIFIFGQTQQRIYMKKKRIQVRDSRDHMRAHENFIIIIIIITKQKRRYTRGFCWCKKKELSTLRKTRTGNIINRHHQTSVRSWRGEHRRCTFERLRQQRELNTPDIQSVSSSF